MATIYPTPASTVKQHINKDVAMYIHEHTERNIDELLIVAATPAIRADFKSIEQKSLCRVMLKMKLFLKKRQRFLNFTKEGIKEGLMKEWLPTIEDEDEKIRLLEDIAVIVRIEDDGTIVTKDKVYEEFVKANISDGKYGDAPYQAPEVKRSAPKEPIKEVKPIAQLEEKLAPYIVWYKRGWKYMVNHEGYKWEATKQFQQVFDINAENLAANLKEALSKEIYLLSGRMNFSKDTLLKNAEYSPEDIRSALAMLFDENIDLAKRADDFIAQFNAIHEANKAAGHIKPNQAPHQNPHSVYVYLAFAHPSRHYIFKQTVWQDFKYETELDDYPSLNRFAHKLVGYEQICNHIREILIADKELVALHDASYPSDNSDYHLLTQDFIYAIGVHFIAFDKKPAYFNENDAKLYQPNEIH